MHDIQTIRRMEREADREERKRNRAENKYRFEYLREQYGDALYDKAVGVYNALEITQAKRDYSPESPIWKLLYSVDLSQ